MKYLKICYSIFVIMFFGSASLWAQNSIRDSLIDESLRDFFLKHEEFISESNVYMIDAQTFPINYNISKWRKKNKLEIADFRNNNTIKKYKKAKDGYSTIRFRWEIFPDGSIMYNIALYSVTIKKNIINYALSEVYKYHYKYSDTDRKWLIITKTSNGF